MGDIYKNIDFERMLSDLGAALERNTAQPGTRPAEQPAAAPAPAPAPGVPTARFPDVQPGMQVQGTGTPTPLSPQDQQTSNQLDAAAPGAVAFGAGRPPPAPMSPQDQQTLAQLSAIEPSALAFGAGRPMPHPAHAPPPGVAAQLAGAAAAPTAMSAPPTVYPNIDPNAAGGLAGYAALQR